MRERDRMVAAASVVAWTGVAAFLVCLVVRKVAPYPRWDLLACLTVSAGAVLAWWLRASGRPVDTERVAAALGQSAPAGRRRTRWWPESRFQLVLLALVALTLPLVMLFLSTKASTPQLAAISAHGPRIAEVTITQVHRSVLKTGKSSSHYESEVTATAVGGGRSGKESLRLEGTLKTPEPPHPGDRSPGLYAPDDPAAGVIMDSRAELRSLLGGPPGPQELMVLGVCAFFTLAGAAGALRTRAAARATAGVFGAGETRMLRVRVVGAGAGDRLWRPTTLDGARRPTPLLTPSLRLASSSGGRDLLLERCLDPVPLAAALRESQGRLYWMPRAGDQPEWSAPALLVLDDGRYVRGATPLGTSLDAASGEPVAGPRPVPEPSRPALPYAVWQPQVHTPGAICFGAAFLAVVLLVSGGGYGCGALRTVCLLVAAAGPLVGVLAIGHRRTRYLRQLMQKTRQRV
ncbi:hypothetical protein [Streptomyces inhibens]|uniref:hypothetical protein n=1 Tax=Streptomyces inhibens TaxID=2293571 RepID=UPI001EE704AB|nr:hypothetical protein [Streptomyces inhibens]UKY47787.1 hypothetical protein KI385_02340 [Streptomyces inhibens]